MLNTEKQEVLDAIVPKAILKALTNGSKNAIIKKSCGLEDVISIYNYPFKIGREARVRHSKEGVVLRQRCNPSKKQKPSNDAYLLDSGNYLQISRKHCSILLENDRYILRDRGSACGSLVNDKEIGDAHDDSYQLEDGDIITLGSKDSQFKYKFITLVD